MEKEQEVKLDEPQETKVPQVYLRLEGIYQGDIQMDEGKYITAFLLHFVDNSGHMYLAPVTCKKEYFVTVQKNLSRLFPVIVAFTEEDGIYQSDKPKTEGLASVSALNTDNEDITTH